CLYARKRSARVKIERRDTRDGGGSEGDALRIGAFIACSNPEQREIHGISADARPRPRLCRALREQPKTARHLAHAQQAHYLRAIADADRPTERSRRENFGEPEPDTEPPQYVSEPMRIDSRFLVLLRIDLLVAPFRVRRIRRRVRGRRTPGPRAPGRLERFCGHRTPRNSIDFMQAIF